jgi:YD repeat-containing protein
LNCRLGCRVGSSSLGPNLGTGIAGALTFAGVTVLRFDEQGKVVEHRDYDNHVERREPPYAGWTRKPSGE